MPYDYLVIGTGAGPCPDQAPGMLGGLQWRRSIFDFYSLDGAADLKMALVGFRGGRFVVHITDVPIKCPVAPLEVTFLTDDYFHRHRIREQVEMV